jgi:CHRD domain-containing protein
MVRRTLVLGLVICAAAGAYTALAGATSSRNDRFTASLNRGQEVPKPKGVSVRASGRFTATLSGSKLKWTLTFKHLTGKAIAAHIHSGKRGKAGIVLVPLCGPCKSGASGTAVVTSAEVKAMKKGDLYVNVHTVKNPAGEIRGQIHG